MCGISFSIFFFFNDTATTEIYTLSLHDALPISRGGSRRIGDRGNVGVGGVDAVDVVDTSYIDDAHHVGHQALVEVDPRRSEEHTSELQSPCNLVCRLLLEKKKKLIGE